MSYTPLTPHRTTQIQRGDLSLSVQEWGDPSDPPLFLCHGWMDSGKTWQFVIDNFSDKWHVIAPDWRGFGNSDWPSGSYWFPDYYADLEAILDHYSADEAVNIVGHSMGGNIISLYAGIRPERIARLVNLEGFGMPTTEPADIPKRIANWLDALKTPAELKEKKDFSSLEKKLKRDNKHLPDDRAAFIARCWAIEKNGKVEMLADPRHKSTNPAAYNRGDAISIWNNISAKTLWLRASESFFISMLDAQREQGESYRPDHEETIPESGHMMHWERPAEVARLIERFIKSDGECSQ